MRIFDLPQQIRAILSQLDDGGEVTDDLIGQLADLERQSGKDFEYQMKVLRELIRSEDAINAELADLRAFAKKRSEQIRGVKSRIRDLMDVQGLTEVTAGPYKAKFAFNPPSVHIPENLTVEKWEHLCIEKPEFREYLRIEKEISRQSLAEAIKSGKDVPEGVIFIQGKSLRFTPA
jgi:hypothetical protein